MFYIALFGEYAILRRSKNSKGMVFRLVDCTVQDVG